MKIIECVQLSREWTEARLAIPTASQYHRIITPRTMKPSSSASGYLYELIAEWVLGQPLDNEGSLLMERGKEMEAEAVRFYEMDHNCETRQVGFCLHENRPTGCSPDRLVGGDGGLEIKCPSPKVHVGYLLDGVSEEYRCQVQGQLWITGRQWWDLLSYHPDMPPALVRIERDEEFIAALSMAVDGFCQRLDNAKKQMIQLGVVPQSKAA